MSIFIKKKKKKKKEHIKKYLPQLGITKDDL